MVTRLLHATCGHSEKSLHFDPQRQQLENRTILVLTQIAVFQEFEQPSIHAKAHAATALMNF